MTYTDTDQYDGYLNYQTYSVAMQIRRDSKYSHIAAHAQDYREYCQALRGLGILETQDYVAFNDSALDVACLNKIVSGMTL